ncbi:MAG: hypothetical protein ACREJQ_02710 [bacterium]
MENRPTSVKVEIERIGKDLGAVCKAIQDGELGRSEAYRKMRPIHKSILACAREPIWRTCPPQDEPARSETGFRKRDRIGVLLECMDHILTDLDALSYYPAGSENMRHPCQEAMAQWARVYDFVK